MNRSVNSTATADSSAPETRPAPDRRVVYDLARFTLADMVRCGIALREIASVSASMEEAAQKVTRYLFETLRYRDSPEPASVLVRFFKTQAYAALPEELQKFASAIANSSEIQEDTKCLILLGTAGQNPDWNSRHSSAEHKGILLESASLVQRSPMVSQLISALGLTTSQLLKPTDEILRELNQRESGFGVFFVSDAVGSSFIPAQTTFVKPYGVVSVIGFGGILADGNIFAVIIFARVHIDEATADLFRTVALNLKLGLLNLMNKPVFSADSPAPRIADASG